MIIQGKRINLRPLERDDLPLRLEMVNDPDVQRVTTGTVADETSEHDMYAWFQLYSEDPHSEQWAIVDKNGTYLGDIDLHSIKVLDDEAWINTLFGDDDVRQDWELRREALYLIVEYALFTKDVAEVNMDIPDVDKEGIELLASLGFEQTDTLEMNYLTGAQLLTYTVTKASFKR